MSNRYRSIKSLPAVIGCAAVLALGACTSTPAVRASSDQTTDFAQYKTFGFMSPLSTDRAGYRTIVSKQLMAATQREMEARGMRLVDSAPQLLVNFSGQLAEKLRVSSAPYAGMYGGRGYYGYRAGMYSTWPMYIDQTIVTQYTEGTLNVDVVDAARKQLVWEGVVTNSVTQKDLDDTETAINLAVAAIFAKYPTAAAAK